MTPQRVHLIQLVLFAIMAVLLLANPRAMQEKALIARQRFAERHPDLERLLPLLPYIGSAMYIRVAVVAGWLCLGIAIVLAVRLIR